MEAPEVRNARAHNLKRTRAGMSIQLTCTKGTSRKVGRGNKINRRRHEHEETREVISCSELNLGLLPATVVEALSRHSS